jgi:hypothetical protein
MASLTRSRGTVMDLRNYGRSENPIVSGEMPDVASSERKTTQTTRTRRAGDARPRQTHRTREKRGSKEHPSRDRSGESHGPRERHSRDHSSRDESRISHEEMVAIQAGIKEVDPTRALEIAHGALRDFQGAFVGMMEIATKQNEDFNEIFSDMARSLGSHVARIAEARETVGSAVEILFNVVQQLAE